MMSKQEKDRGIIREVVAVLLNEKLMFRFLSCWVLFVFIWLGGPTSAEAETYPREIWIDNRFDDEQEIVILEAMKEWEIATKRDLFIYRGRVEDWEQDLHDTTRETNVIFLIKKPPRVRGSVYCVEPVKDSMPSYLGWHIRGKRSDILICQNEINDFGDDDILLTLKFTVIYELGHFLGLRHGDNPDSVTYPTLDTEQRILPKDVLRFEEILNRRQGGRP